MRRRIIIVGIAVCAMLLVGLTGAVSASSGGGERVDSDVTVTEWTWDDDNDRFLIELENDAETSKMVTVTEAFSEGSGQIGIEQERIGPNSTTSMSFEPRLDTRNPRMIIQTQDGIDEGDVAGISVKDAEQNPFTAVPVSAGWVGGFLGILWTLGYHTTAKLRKHSGITPMGDLV